MNRIFGLTLLSLVVAGLVFAATPAFNIDLLNLELDKPIAVTAYKQVKITDALSFLNTLSPVARQVRIGIIDSGVDMAHQEFDGVNIDAAAIAEKDNETGGHGTQIAGIIGAKGNNNIGIAGTMWDTNLKV